MTSHPRNLIKATYASFLVPGERYRVAKAFLDAARSVHPVGEVWTYVGYLPNGAAEATYFFTDFDGAFAAPWEDDPDSFCNNPRPYLQHLQHEA
jgi:hypothetical protein